MEVVFPYCAGLDVHKKRVTACRLVSDSTGQAPEGVAELQTFGTMTHELLALADWLVEAGVTHVAMESTGEYWKPVYNLLEGIVTIFLVNAAYSTDSCHPIHGKVATQSTGSLPPSPRETCHSIHGKVATHSRRSLPPSERSDAGWHIISLNWLFLSTGPAVCAWILLVMKFCTRCGPDDRGWHRRVSDLQGPHASARRGVGS